MTIYYTNETILEFILRIVEKTFSLTAIVLLSGIWIHMNIYNQEINEYEEIYFTDNNIVQEESVSVKEQFMSDIMKLPLPEETLEEAIEEETEVAQTVERISETTPEYEMSYKQSDVELLARLMYAEEGIFIYKLSEEDSKYVCQLAGSVVIHRKNMNYGGADTIEEVIYAEGQYQCVANGSINQEVPDIVYEWAEELLQNGPIGPENMVYQAEFEQGSEVYDHVGNQYFCVM